MFTVLALDRDSHVLNHLTRVLVFRLDLHTSRTAGDALQRLAVIPFDFMVIGQVDGISLNDLVAQVHLRSPGTAIILQTSDIPTMVQLYNDGMIQGAISPGAPPHEVERLLDALIQHRQEPTDNELRLTTMREIIQLMQSIGQHPFVESLLAGFEDACEKVTQELGGAYAWRERLAVSLVPMGFSLLGPDEQTEIRAGEFRTSPYQLAIRRAFLSIADLTGHLPKLQPVSTLLRQVPFCHGEWNEVQWNHEAFAHVIHLCSTWAILKNQGYSGNKLRRTMHDYFPEMSRRMETAIHTLNPRQANEIVIPLCELRAGMVLMQSATFKAGNMMLPAGTRVDREVFAAIETEVRNNRSKTVAVARESVVPDTAAGFKTNFFVEKQNLGVQHSGCRFYCDWMKGDVPQ